jgi:hypothetical protein
LIVRDCKLKREVRGLFGIKRNGINREIEVRGYYRIEVIE